MRSASERTASHRLPVALLAVALLAGLVTAPVAGAAGLRSGCDPARPALAYHPGGCRKGRPASRGHHAHRRSRIAG